MGIVHICSGDKRLLISSKTSILNDLKINRLSPKVVLLTAWSQEVLCLGPLLIKELLQLGCTYFVCAGSYAEEAHDFIDQFIENCNDKFETVITTYHDDEPADLVVNFFFNCTSSLSQETDSFVAILNDTLPDDALFKQELLKF